METELEHRMDDFRRLVLERNAEEVVGVLDEDFALVIMHPNRFVMPRAAWLAALPDYVVHSWERREHALDIDGDCAVVMQWVDMKATVFGEDRSGAFIITDVWRRRDDGWRIWRRHSTPLDAGAMPLARAPSAPGVESDR